MTQRERLIELLQSVPADYEGNRGVGSIADYLLANGVIVPLLQLGCEKGENMKKITKQELNTFLIKHKLWLEVKKGGERANLSEANLSGADLSGAKDVAFPIACPEEGEFIGFKKARGEYIVKLKIPDDAKRCSATGRKCRCSKALVLSITKTDGTDDGTTEIASLWDETFIYRVGEIVEVSDFGEDRWEECAPGIHFFITRKEAEKYNV